MVALFVILTIVAFIAVDSFVQWSEAKQQRRRLGPVEELSRRLTLGLDRIQVPAGVFLAPGHTWVRLDLGGTAHIGLDQFVQKAIGRMEAVALPDVGRTVHRGETLFTVRQGRRVASFRSPLEATVVAVNENVAQHPQAIAEDPYVQGWIVVVRPRQLASALRDLFIAEHARAWLREELERFKQFIASRPLETVALGQALQDGGDLTTGVLELMDEETWNLFTQEFLAR
jgi:glycine cleavage system H protein